MMHILKRACFFIYAIGILIELSCSNSNPAVVEDSPLMLVCPSGGETLFIGDTLYITWRASSEYIASIKVLVSVGGNDASEYLVSGKSFLPSDSCAWVIGSEYALPSGMLPSDSVRIIIRDYDDLFSDITERHIRVKKRE